MHSDAQGKRLINGSSETANQLMPIHYRWAWEHYLNGCANHWLPHEVPMGDDVELWKSDLLTPEERLLLTCNFCFFSIAETLVANNIALALYKQLSNAECRQYLIRQAFEEAIHTEAFFYICESLTLDSNALDKMAKKIPAIREKEAFQIELTQTLLAPSFSTASTEGASQFLENLIGYYVVMEGIFFYGGFAMVLALKRQNKMRGICQIYEFILRDETIHLNFGIDLINGIKEENPHLWTPLL